MNIQTAHYAQVDLAQVLNELRARAKGDSEMVSEASQEKTIELFGEPLSVKEVVARIIRDVRMDGDKAVAGYAHKLDRILLEPEDFRIPRARILEALDEISADLADSLRLADKHIRAFQETLLQSDPFALQGDGTFAQVRYRPLRRVGVCVPGMAAPLPSTVLMAAVPAQVAGVQEVVVFTPPGKNGRVNPAVLAAAAIAGIDDVYQIGGAHAVAAFALGTDTLERVDKIVGPGNAFVAEAKRQLFGEVGIDSIAGPSEILIIADHTARADYVAADILGQAEHDPGCAVLITSCDELLPKVERELARQVEELPRRAAAVRGLENHSLLAVAESVDQAAELAEVYAPEHLEIMTENPEALADRISNAGAIFLGEDTPESVGDYIAGPSHTLPTGGAARFMAGLSARDFVKGTSIIRYSHKALENVAGDVVRIAEAEGLTAHAASVLARFEAHRRR